MKLEEILRIFRQKIESQQSIPDDSDCSQIRLQLLYAQEETRGGRSGWKEAYRRGAVENNMSETENYVWDCNIYLNKFPFGINYFDGSTKKKKILEAN